MNSMDSDIRFPSRSRALVALLGMALVAFFIAFALSFLPSSAAASHWSWNPHDPHTGDSLYTQCHNHIDDNAGNGIDMKDPACASVDDATPEALNQNIVTDEGVATSTVLTGTDDDDDILYFTISTLPQHGTLTCAASPCVVDSEVGSTDGTIPNLTYTPDVGYSGTDQIDFTASDGLKENDATLFVTVTAPPAPVAVVTATDQTVTTLQNTALNITLAGTDSIPANTLTFATSSNSTNGTLIVTADPAVFTYMPNSGFTGGDTFTFTAGDGTATSTGTVSITVNAPAPQGGGNGGSTPAASTNGGGGGGGGGVISGPLSVGFVNTNSGGGNGGEVLGASTDTPASCSIYLSGYLKKGSSDSAAIKKLQIFLNQNLGLSIPVTGVFGPMTEAAVEQFQTKYADDILKPWFTQGFSHDMQPSGYVYKTTLRMINLLQCSSLEIPQPQLP